MDTQNPEQKQNEQAQQVQATEQETQKKPATPAKQPTVEKTQEELDYEAGYYACCFRSH